MEERVASPPHPPVPWAGTLLGLVLLFTGVHTVERLVTAPAVFTG